MAITDRVGIGEVYKKGNFGDARFSSLPKDRVAELGLELTMQLREVFPDSRRGEPWFGPLSLFKRHKTRAESRKRKKKVESGGSGCHNLLCIHTNMI